ncbi:MAG: DUF2807 domain-containing protein [Saprospiraceae bacterium]|nr:DUF2807 domain-containing protein [Saprospiraceae bacterium]
MKNLGMTTAMFLMYVSLFGQLRGSAKLIEKQFDYSNFDKIGFVDLDGNINVEIGKSWSIKVTIDDNILPLLAFDEDKPEGRLKIFLKGNNSNRMYIEDTNIRITISMPEVSVITHDGNSRLTVNNISGRYLKIQNLSNSSTTVQGSIDQLDIINAGNGNLYATELIAKTSDIKCSGNGNVKVNVNNKLSARVSGNGNVVNKGKASFKNSSSTGNGNLIQL